MTLTLPLRHHGRYEFSGIVTRPAGTWPGGQRLAVYVALNLEQYGFGEGLVEDLVPPLGQPDVMNYAWRDWGNRVGAWRLLNLFDELAITPSLLVNSALYDAAPGLIEAFRAIGAPVVAHGRTNAEAQAGLNQTEEAALIAEARDQIARHEGRAPRGWLGPWISENRANSGSVGGGRVRLRPGLVHGRSARLASHPHATAAGIAIPTGVERRQRGRATPGLRCGFRRHDRRCLRRDARIRWRTTLGAGHRLACPCQRTTVPSPSHPSGVPSYCSSARARLAHE